MALETVQDTENIIQCAKCGQFVSTETDSECWNCFMNDAADADPDEGSGAVAWMALAVAIGIVLVLWLAK